MPKNQRYRTESFYAKSLEKNIINDSPYKKFKGYLPPGYFEEENQTKNYPVIYLLHGYGASINNLIVLPKKNFKHNYLLILRIILRKFFRSMICYEELDQLIIQGSIQPFILIQPDGSLPLFHKYNKIGYNGLPVQKGSMYINSPFTGNYNDYIFQDLIHYVDETYRTLADKEHRALIGGSMGGFGALLGGIMYPDKFNIVFALSPLICFLDLLKANLYQPLFAKVFGTTKAKQFGRKDLIDILETVDLIFSKNNPFLTELEFQSEKVHTKFNEGSKENWEKNDLNNLIQQFPNAFNKVRLKFNSEETDEFGFHNQVETFHQTLSNLNIAHEYEIYKDEMSQNISAHTIGIANKVREAILYCLNYI